MDQEEVTWCGRCNNDDHSLEACPFELSEADIEANREFHRKSAKVTVGDIEKIMEVIDHRFELMEKRVETNEQHMAELTVAYMEINASVEALLNHIFGSQDTPEAIAYREAYAKIKTAMFTWMEHASKSMAQGEDSLNEAVLRLVRDSNPPGSPPASDTDPGDHEVS